MNSPVAMGRKIYSNIRSRKSDNLKSFNESSLISK